MKKIRFEMSEEQMLIAQGYELVLFDSNYFTGPILVLPPLGVRENPYIKLEDGRKIELNCQVRGAIWRHVENESALADLADYMTMNGDSFDDDEKKLIEENKDCIVLDYFDYQMEHEWWDDMSSAIEGVLSKEKEDEQE